MVGVILQGDDRKRWSWAQYENDSLWGDEEQGRGGGRGTERVERQRERRELVRN